MHIRTLASQNKTVMLYVRGPSQQGYRWELLIREDNRGTRSVLSEAWFSGWKGALESGLSAQEAHTDHP